MNFQRIFGIILVIAGFALIFTSVYIKREVQEGKGEISSAQAKVDRGRKFFDIIPETAPIGKGLTEGAQEKIDQGRRDVAYYEKLSNWLMNGGIVLVVLGIVIIIFGKGRKRASKR